MSHLPRSWFTAVDAISKPTGLPHDQLRMVLCLIAAIPLGEFHKRLPTPYIKHLFSFGIGFFFGWFVVGHGAFHVLMASLCVYALGYYLPRRIMPHLITLFLIVYLSYAHLHRMYYDYLGWEMDVSLILMIFVVKASTFAFNYADGLAMAKEEKLHQKPHLHQHRAERALRVFPSLLEYLSYIWFFGGVLVGPCFEMQEYLNSVDLSALKQYGLTQQPSAIGPAMERVLYALLSYPFIYVHTLLPILGFVNTPAFYAMPFLKRFGYFWTTMTCSRYKYYFAWYLGEAGCVSAGLALSGRDEKGQFEWERCANVHAWKVETATSMPQITNNWNMGINNWLKHYIYFRVDPPLWMTKIIPAKSIANIVTKFTSAFWHGFYPAYYLFFLGAYIVNEMDDAMRSHILPYITGGEDIETWNKPTAAADGAASNTRSPTPLLYVYNVVAWLLIFFGMNTLGMAFMLLEASTSLQFWASLYYSVFWVPLLVIAVCYIGFPKKRSQDGTKKRATPAEQQSRGEIHTDTTQTQTGTAVKRVTRAANANGQKTDL